MTLLLNGPRLVKNKVCAVKVEPKKSLSVLLTENVKILYLTIKLYDVALRSSPNIYKSAQEIR